MILRSLKKKMSRKRRGQVLRRMRAKGGGRDLQSLEVPTSLSVLLRLDVPDVVSLGLGLLSVVVESRDVGLSPEVILEEKEGR